MFLTSDIPTYDLLGLNLNNFDKISKHMLDNNSVPVYSELKEIQTYVHGNQDTEFCRDEEDFR